MLEFPGAKAEQPLEWPSINQAAELYGVPVWVGGRSELSNIDLLDGEREWKCVANRAKAILIAHHLYTATLRVYGKGRWRKTPGADWELERFVIEDFDVTKASNLEQTIQGLRTIKADWKSLSDPLGQLDAIPEWGKLDQMVVFDNSIFCLTLHPDAKPRSSVDPVQDRIQHLLETLRDNGEVAIIPAPALSEFLVFAGKSAPEYLLKIRESSFLRIEPFDERAAIELADREISAREKGNKRGSATTSDWQKVKFDRQIVAVALVHKASAIYSDDPDIVTHGKDCGLKVLSLADLPLPPSRQITIEEVLLREEPTPTTPAIDPVPAPNAGSAPGPAQSETGAETAKTEGEADQD